MFCTGVLFVPAYPCVDCQLVSPLSCYSFVSILYKKPWHIHPCFFSFLVSSSMYVSVSRSCIPSTQCFPCCPCFPWIPHYYNCLFSLFYPCVFLIIKIYRVVLLSLSLLGVEWCRLLKTSAFLIYYTYTHAHIGWCNLKHCVSTWYSSRTYAESINKSIFSFTLKH